MKKFGLRASHTMCLYYLGRYDGGLTATQLTELCKEDKAAISRCLGQLYREKTWCHVRYLKINVHIALLIILQKKGKGLLIKSMAGVEVALSNGGNGLSDEQRRTFMIPWR